MKKLAVLFAVLFATAAFAVDAPKGPVSLEAKNGNVSFDHAKHAAVKCDVCHKGAPGKIGKMDQKAGHAACQTCHTEQAKGPQAKACKECHKK
jgi:hypothetical protein